ncbi:MAG: hypothetical protein ABSH38_10580 [Verrucomicrobiota bacterium]|jgi:hypothetical protein
MKPILETNEPDFGAGFLESRGSILDNGNLYSSHSTELSQARRTFMRRAPEALKLVRRIAISWLDGPPFQPRLHSAVPIYPRVLNSRIRRRMIRRHNIL